MLKMARTAKPIVADETALAPETETETENLGKYKPEYCDKIIKLVKDNGFTMHQLARELNISVDTLYTWARKYPKFGDAKDRAADYRIAWLDEIAAQNFQNRFFNSRTFEMVFAHAMRQAAYRSLKKIVAQYTDPQKQCYHILDYILDGAIDSERGESMINVILAAIKAEEATKIRDEIEMIKQIQSSKKPANEPTKPAPNAA